MAIPSIISDDQMTASSNYSSYWLPHYGHLSDTRGGGWAARLSSSVSDWLQIDFERTVQVCAVETQGDVAVLRGLSTFTSLSRPMEHLGVISHMKMERKW